MNISNDCSNFSDSDKHKLSVASYVASTLSCTSGLLTVFLILALGALRNFVHRLTLYLTLAVLLTPVIHAVSMHMLFNEHYDSGVCIGFGFLLQYANWVEVLVICWIELYVFVLVVLEMQLRSVKLEVAGVLTVTFVPLLFSWEPFIEAMYGPAGVWCWIKSSKDGCSGDGGLAYQIGLFYGPLIVLLLLNMAENAVVIAILCRRYLTRKSSHLRRQHWKAIMEVAPIYVYPTIVFVTFLVGCASRTISAVYSSRGEHFPVGMTLVMVLCLSSRGLYLPIAFLLQPRLCSKCTCRSNQYVRVAKSVSASAHASCQSRSDTHYSPPKDSVSAED